MEKVWPFQRLVVASQKARKSYEFWTCHTVLDGFLTCFDASDTYLDADYVVNYHIPPSVSEPAQPSHSCRV